MGSVVKIPTGFGKSLIYQALPLVCNTARGTTGHIVVVVSPPVNFMKDQVVKLANIGIPAVTLNDISKANMSVVERGAYRFFKKYNQFSRSGPWSATHDLGEITFRRIKGNGLCFRRRF